MNVFHDKKLRFSDAVYALDTTPKSLRKWLQNPEFSLISEQREGEWKNFSAADIACLAIMRKLVDFCVGVPLANRIAKDVIKRRLGPLLGSKTMPHEAFESAFRGFFLAAWKEREEWKFSLGSPHDLEPNESAFLLIYIDQVIEAALGRAIEMSSDGDSDDSTPGNESAE